MTQIQRYINQAALSFQKHINGDWVQYRDVQELVKDLNELIDANTDLENERLEQWKQIKSFIDLFPEPMCRDCADSFGICPTSGLPCSSPDRVIEKIKRLQVNNEKLEEQVQALQTRLKESSTLFAVPKDYKLTLAGKDHSVEVQTEVSNPTPSHYQYSYKGIKFDPYRVCQVYNIPGGPREHLIKKALRGVSKGHTQVELIGELRACLDRWAEMLEEDNG